MIEIRKHSKLPIVYDNRGLKKMLKEVKKKYDFIFLKTITKKELEKLQTVNIEWFEFDGREYWKIVCIEFLEKMNV